MKLKIIKSEGYELATQAIKANQHNQCCCVPSYAWTEDTKCLCTEFRNQDYEGSCHCDRYKKILVEED